MMLLLRRILRGGTRRSFLLSLGLAAAMVLALAPAQPASACWRTELTECFDRLVTTWPWATHTTPVERRWRLGTNVAPISWGITDRVFNPNAPGCQANQQSVWCIGYPDLGQDPDFDVYGPNWSTYMLWGPVNLATAVEAQVSFWLYSRCGLGDSVYWGACRTTDPTVEPRIGGSRLTRTTDWEFQLMDLTNMRNQAGDSVSMLGLSTVYVWWRLKADPSQTPEADHDMGPFVDNITVSWDDGQQDIRTQMPIFYEIVGSTYQMLTRAHIGDSVYAAFTVTTCNGGLDAYPPFSIVAWLNDTLKVYDSTFTGVPSQSSMTLTTSAWRVQNADSNFLRIYVDSANVVLENNETNNRITASFGVMPPNPHPEFEWLTAQAETLVVPQTQSNFTMHWEAYDTDEQARITVYYDTDGEGCTGGAIVGGNNRIERDGPDSLVWNIQNLPLNTPYYLLARISDADTMICVHTAFPFIRVPSSAVDRPLSGVVPEHFFLAQNYPNPFNPQTELRFGLAKAGQVTLRVFDITGREVALLIDGERTPGSYSVNFNGSHLATGLYFYTLTTPEGTDSRKMMLLK